MTSSPNLSRKYYNEQRRKEPDKYGSMSFSEWKDVKSQAWEERQAQRSQSKIKEAESMAEDGKVYVYTNKGGGLRDPESYDVMSLDQFRKLSNQKDYRVFSREEYNQRVQKARGKAYEEKMRDRAVQEQETKKQELREKYGVSKDTEVIFVDKKTYAEVQKAKSPTILNGQLYKNKEDAVRTAVGISMRDKLERARILQSWENKRAWFEFEDQFRDYQSQVWAQKRAQAGIQDQPQANKLLDTNISQETISRIKQMDPADINNPQAFARDLARDFKDPQAQAQAQADYLDQVKANQDFRPINTQKSPEMMRSELTTERGLDQFNINEPVSSLKRITDRWGRDLELRHQEKTQGFRQRQDQASQLYQEQLRLTTSQETQDPFMRLEKLSQEVRAPKIKDSAVMLGSSVLTGVAQAGKGIFIDLPLHPVQAVKGFGEMVSHPVQAGGQLISEVTRDPIKTITRTSTELFLFKRLTEGASRILRPKVQDIPIQAKGVKSMKTVRDTGTTTEIQIETVTGKARSRFFWQKPKIKPRSRIALDMERSARSGFSESGYVEQSGSGKGVLKLKDGKAQIEITDYTETGQPSRVLDLDMAETGKLPSGTPIDGKTPGLKKSPGVDISQQVRKGYTYERTVKTDLFDFEDGGRYPWIKKQTVNVPEIIKNKVRITDVKTFKSGGDVSGNLLLEEQMAGKFSKFEKAPKSQPQSPLNPGPKAPGGSVVAEFGKDGSFKLYSVTESGGEIPFVGEKPLSPRSQSMVQSFTKTLQQTKGAELPVVDVKTVKPQTVSLPVIAPESKGQEARGVMPSLVVETREKTETQSSPVLSLEKPPKPKEMLSLDTFTELERKNKNKETIDLKPLEATESRLNLMTLPGLEDLQVQEPGLEPVIDIKTDTNQRERMIMGPQLMSLESFDAFQGFEMDPFSETGTAKSSLRIKKDDERIEEIFKGFDVFVKSRGKFAKVNKEGSLLEGEALAVGSGVVDETASATFMIRPSKDPLNPVRQSSARDLAKFELMGGGRYTEKSKYRIDTPGEVAGISRLGQVAQRTKGFIREANKVLPRALDEFAVPSIANEGKTNKSMFGGRLI